MKKYILLVIVVIAAIACRKEYDLELEKNDSKLVVDACITNTKGPHFVRLSQSFTKQVERETKPGYYKTVLDEPVKDALVMIKDDQGTIDTLELLDDTFLNEYNDGYPWKPYYLEEQNNGEIDTIFINTSHYDFDRNAIYKTSKTQGLPGRTYTLSIKWKGKEYFAQEYMHPILKIDSTGYRYEEGMPGKSSYYVPLLYFQNPSETHPYYLTNLQAWSELDNLEATGIWYYAVINTNYLAEYVNGLFVEDGDAEDWWCNNYNSRFYGDDSGYYNFFDIKISSLTEEAYNYYKQLSESFGQDGGAYKPAPATAQGNISNGALGYFRVSADTTFRIITEEKKFE